MVDYDKTHESPIHVKRCGQAVGQAALPQGIPKPRLDPLSTIHDYCNVNWCWLTPLHNVDTLWEMKIRFWSEENKCNFPFKQHINSQFPSVKPHAIDKAQFARYKINLFSVDNEFELYRLKGLMIIDGAGNQIIREGESALLILF